jgi:hypothetical protein
MWVAKTEELDQKGTSMRVLMRADALAVERHVLGMGEYKPYARSV